MRKSFPIIGLITLGFLIFYAYGGRKEVVSANHFKSLKLTSATQDKMMLMIEAQTDFPEGTQVFLHEIYTQASSPESLQKDLDQYFSWLPNSQQTTIENQGYTTSLVKNGRLEFRKHISEAAPAKAEPFSKKYYLAVFLDCQSSDIREALGTTGSNLSNLHLFDLSGSSGQTVAISPVEVFDFPGYANPKYKLESVGKVKSVKLLQTRLYSGKYTFYGPKFQNAKPYDRNLVLYEGDTLEYVGETYKHYTFKVFSDEIRTVEKKDAKVLTQRVQWPADESRRKEVFESLKTVEKSSRKIAKKYIEDSCFPNQLYKDITSPDKRIDICAPLFFDRIIAAEFREMKIPFLAYGAILEEGRQKGW